MPQVAPGVGPTGSTCPDGWVCSAESLRPPARGWRARRWAQARGRCSCGGASQTGDRLHPRALIPRVRGCCILWEEPSSVAWKSVQATRKLRAGDPAGPMPSTLEDAPCGGEGWRQRKRARSKSPVRATDMPARAAQLRPGLPANFRVLHAETDLAWPGGSPRGCSSDAPRPDDGWLAPLGEEGEHATPSFPGPDDAPSWALVIHRAGIALQRCHPCLPTGGGAPGDHPHATHSDSGPDGLGDPPCFTSADVVLREP